MNVHLVDGTYELFRAWFAAPKSKTRDGREVGASRALLRMLARLRTQHHITHIGCAFDHVIESFRNQLFAGYKTGEGVEPELLAQFPLAERISHALGYVTWSMVEFEADDALASAAKCASDDRTVEKVVICSLDKDLTQCVRHPRVVCLDRFKEIELDANGVREKFGVAPASIPDWLALVGDSADGIPGVPKWGAVSAAKLLSKYERLENIPNDASAWSVTVRGAASLAESYNAHREVALLYRTLATLREDVNVGAVADWKWQGVRKDELGALLDELEDRRFQLPE